MTSLKKIIWDERFCSEGMLAMLVSDLLFLAPYVLLVGWTCTIGIVGSSCVLVVAEIKPHHGT